jgi:dolichyl-phosphate-mannose--protein O-mannosyl transferase
MGGPTRRPVDDHSSGPDVVYSENSPWLSLILYAVLLNTLILLAGSYASLAGSTKIYPRVFFGVFVAGIPLFLFSSLSFMVATKRFYPRVLWDLLALLFVQLVTCVATVAMAFRHIRIHGNEAATMPFEVQRDLGTTFIIAHAVIFASSLVLIGTSARAIIGYCLDGYPLSPYKKD